MITVCDGWDPRLKHERLVLKNDGRPSLHVSHGMCERCSLLMDAQLRGITGQALDEYAAYLMSPIDPRD